MLTRFINILKGWLIAIILIIQPVTVAAEVWHFSSPINQLTDSGFSMERAVAGLTDLSTKSNQGYDESQDPAMHKSPPPDEGPKHGFFAVSLVILGILGLFIYFLKVD